MSCVLCIVQIALIWTTTLCFNDNFKNKIRFAKFSLRRGLCLRIRVATFIPDVPVSRPSPGVALFIPTSPVPRIAPTGGWQQISAQPQQSLSLRSKSVSSGCFAAALARQSNAAYIAIQSSSAHTGSGPPTATGKRKEKPPPQPGSERGKGTKNTQESTGTPSNILWCLASPDRVRKGFV